MRILIACEESQRVCIAFRELGHEAYSCDIEPCSGGNPEYHIQRDVLPLLNGNCKFETVDGKEHRIDGKWDMIIAFPPCTYLTVAGNRWFDVEKYGQKALDRMESRKKAIQFFMEFVNADCERIAIENPIGVMSAEYQKPDQIIQPWMFGENASKSTCLWLKNLKKLEPTDIVRDKEKRKENQKVSEDGRLLSFDTKNENGKIMAWNDPETAKIRSKTFPGIAKAMAEQWGGFILNDYTYYSQRANEIYFSVSQYKDFLQCESMAMAIIRGEYKKPETVAMLMGSYFDRYFEGTLPQFMEEHPQLYTQAGRLRSHFARINKIIKYVENNEKFMNYMSGEKQKILIFEMFGAPWKMKMDSFLEGICITDLKLVADEGKIAKIFKYEFQGAVYQYGAEANGYGRLPFYLAVAEKKVLKNALKPEEEFFLNEPVQIVDSVLDEALAKIEEDMPHFINVKKGLEEPERCEKCVWCKMTRGNKVRDYRDFME